MPIARRRTESIPRLWLMLGSVVAISSFLWFLSARCRFTFTNSAGGHLFWRVRCPERLERWNVIELVPAGGFKRYLPTPAWGAQPFHLLKKAACLPGEKVIRRGLHYWCDTGDTRIDLGMVMLKSSKGVPITPFMYQPGKKVASYLVRDGEVFVIGNRAPRSFDSRYFGPVPEGRITGCFAHVF